MASDFKFEDNSAKVEAEMQRLIERTLKTAGLVAEAEIKAQAPVGDTGHLRDTIASKVTGKGSETVVQVGSPLEYSTYVEFGTGEFAENGAGRKGGWTYKDERGKWHKTNGMKPRKFMRNGFRNKKSQIVSILENGLKGLGK